MKSSARNHLAGKIKAMKPGSINTEIEIQLNDGDSSIVAMITNESARSMGFKEGSDAFALVKASWVILVKDCDGLVSSARNQLKGTISSIKNGPVNSEVELTLPGGSKVYSIITGQSARKMGLKSGDEVCALFKASSVIVGV